MSRNILYIVACLTIMSCGGPSVPEVFTEIDRLPNIYPDYKDVTIPFNIAPLTFQLDEAADEMVARYAVGDEEIIGAESIYRILKDNLKKLKEGVDED